MDHILLKESKNNVISKNNRECEFDATTILKIIEARSNIRRINYDADAIIINAVADFEKKYGQLSINNDNGIDILNTLAYNVALFKEIYKY